MSTKDVINSKREKQRFINFNQKVKNIYAKFNKI